jgi:hypothetical protein
MTQHVWIRGARRLAVAASILLAPIHAEPASALGPDRDLAPSLASHLHAMDAALAAQDVRAAVKARHEAEVTARTSSGWEAPLAVGEAPLRLGAAAEVREIAERWARRAFHLTFTRTREASSLEGMLRAAEAFAALGDRETAQHFARVAAELAGKNGGRRDRERVRALLVRED